MRTVSALVAVAGNCDFPGLVIEARGLHGSLELPVTFGAPRYPPAKSFQIEQRPRLGILVRHAEQELFEPVNELLG